MKAYLNGLEGEGNIIIRRTPGGAVAVAAGRWHSQEPDVAKLEGVQGALDDATAVTFEGPVDDPAYPEAANGAKINVKIVTVQEDKGLEGGATGLTCILDPVVPLDYERDSEVKV